MISYKDLKQKILSHPFFSSPFYLKYRHFFMSAIILSCALLISGLVTIPQLFRLFETFENIEELNRKKVFYQSKNITLAGLDLDLYKKNLETALLALPVDKDIPGVTGELLVALSSSGMILTGINFAGSPEQSSQVQEYTLKFELTGTQDSLINFLERVKVSSRIVKMTAIEVSKARQEIVSTSITFVTIYQQLPEHIGNAEDNVPELTASDRQILAEIEQKAAALPRVTNQGSQVPGKLNPFAP